MINHQFFLGTLQTNHHPFDTEKPHRQACQATHLAPLRKNLWRPWQLDFQDMILLFICENWPNDPAKSTVIPGVSFLGRSYVIPDPERDHLPRLECSKHHCHSMQCLAKNVIPQWIGTIPCWATISGTLIPFSVTWLGDPKWKRGVQEVAPERVSQRKRCQTTALGTASPHTAFV